MPPTATTSTTTTQPPPLPPTTTTTSTAKTAAAAAAAAAAVTTPPARLSLAATAAAVTAAAAVGAAAAAVAVSLAFAAPPSSFVEGLLSLAGGGGGFRTSPGTVTATAAAAAAATAAAGAAATLAALNADPKPPTAQSKSSVPTVPSWIPFFGSAFALSSNPNAFLARCRDRFGPVFRVRVAGKLITFVVDQSLFGALMKTPALRFEPVKHNINLAVLDVPQQTLDAMPADEEAIQHGFYVKHLLNGAGALDTLIPRSAEEMVRVMQDVAGFSGSIQQQNGASSSSSAAAASVPLFSTVSRMIFVAGTRALFGSSLDDHLDALHKAFCDFDAGFPLLVAGAPAWALPRAVAARARIAHLLTPPPSDDASGYVKSRAAFFADVLANYTTDPAKPEPAAKTPDDGDVLGKLQLGFFWAANANSIPTAFWTLFYLLRDREAWAAVRDEIRTHLAAADNLADPAATWTRDRLAACPLLDSAVDEALRLTSTSLIMRHAASDGVVDLPHAATPAAENDKNEPPRAAAPAAVRLSFAKGDEIVMYPSLTHYDPAVFPDPTRFRVDRFLRANASPAQRAALVPFGGGKSMCPGRLLAKSQIKIVVALFALRYPDARLVSSSSSSSSSTTPDPAPAFDYGRLGLGVYPPSSDTVRVVLE
ncbi:cytochrome P450 [Zopfochytrium polystomum]|nr:cytochrome P450 [Zopfochytrium polystomum]